jgi:thioredoxin-related protein
MFKRKNINLLLIATILSAILTGFSCDKMRREKPSATDTIKWVSYGESAQQASQLGKHIMLYFWRPGCSWCAKMEATNYSDTSIANIVNAMFIPVKINGWSKDKMPVSSGEISGADLAEQYQLTGYPAVWFLESDGSKINVLPGYAPPDDFKLLLKYVGENHYKSKTFKDFAVESGRVF